MAKKTIEWYNGEPQSLNQAINHGIEFSFVSPDDKQVSPFAYCKDYLQDAVQGCLFKKKREIYGFCYDPKKHSPISTKKTRLIVTNSSDFDFGLKMKNCLDFLHQIEAHLKIRKTIIFECEAPPLKYIRCGIWLFDGSARWVKSPPMLSMYTLLIRLGFGHKIGIPFEQTINEIVGNKISPYQSVDACRLKEAKKGIDLILKMGDRQIFHPLIKNNYPLSIRVGIMHNTMGIIGFSQGKSKKFVPTWHKHEELKVKVKKVKPSTQLQLTEAV